MGKRCFNFLPQAKQIAKQLVLHRLWNGLTQEKVAASLGVTFQQYQTLTSVPIVTLHYIVLHYTKTYDLPPSYTITNYMSKLDTT